LAACQRKRLRLARFPSKRNARNASDCVWMETGPSLTTGFDYILHCVRKKVLAPTTLNLNQL